MNRFDDDRQSALGRWKSEDFNVVGPRDRAEALNS
jgi:hypothetical protein